MLFDQPQRHHVQVAAETCVYSIFVILSGALEFRLPGHVSKVARAGSVVATDYLLHDGQVSCALADTRVLWCTIPEAIQHTDLCPRAIFQLRQLQEQVGKCRHNARRALGRARDTRVRKMPPCADCVMADILA